MWWRSGLVTVAFLLGFASFLDAYSQSHATLDYEIFKTRIEPIFLKKRAGHLQCYVCHEASYDRGLLLEKLPAGQEFWTEDQSKQNFENVSKLVTPGDPDASWLLLHPLAPEAGGDAYHSGGRQFPSKDDPDWRTLADWIRGSH
jgi:hypothetical protein